MSGMQSPTWRRVLRIGLGGLCLALPAQSTKPPQQPLYLPDPTPRPQDPHTQFGDNAEAKVRLQRAAALAREQNHARAVANANQIVLLTQGLRERRAIGNAANVSGSQDVMAVQQVEKLARQIEDLLRTQ